jgi:hypothetical protein
MLLSVIVCGSLTGLCQEALLLRALGTGKDDSHPIRFLDPRSRRVAASSHAAGLIPSACSAVDFAKAASLSDPRLEALP